jgi:hypothetical protein
MLIANQTRHPAPAGKLLGSKATGAIRCYETWLSMQNLMFLAQAADNTGAGVFFGLGSVALILFLVTSIFWIWMLIDALTNNSLDPAMKIVWALVIFFLHLLGAIIYFFVARKSRTTTTTTTTGGL